MRVLLSIKPQYAARILSGEKRFEFRKTPFRLSTSLSAVVIYVTAPVSKIVGEFTLEGILCDKPSALWKLTAPYAGISATAFFEYFQGREKGYALQIGRVQRYACPLNLSDIGVKHAPQSFIYLPE